MPQPLSHRFHALRPAVEGPVDLASCGEQQPFARRQQIQCKRRYGQGVLVIILRDRLGERDDHVRSVEPF
jgi:hypothetical protein